VKDVRWEVFTELKAACDAWKFASTLAAGAMQRERCRGSELAALGGQFGLDEIDEVADGVHGFQLGGLELDLEL
jgi:hypothetical protein